MKKCKYLNEKSGKCLLDLQKCPEINDSRLMRLCEDQEDLKKLKVRCENGEGMLISGD